jgi:hypothetical protein
LTEAKALVGRGNWLPWLEANTIFSERTAQRWMRFAENAETLLAKSATDGGFALAEADRLLAAPKAAPPPDLRDTRQYHHLMLNLARRHLTEKQRQHLIDDPHAVVPPLLDEQYAYLKAKIAEHGLLVPIEKDEDGNTLDGYHRERACRELGITECTTIVRYGLSKEEKREHARNLNLLRRHLAPEQWRQAIREIEEPDSQIEAEEELWPEWYSLAARDEDDAELDAASWEAMHKDD